MVRRFTAPPLSWRDGRERRRRPLNLVPATCAGSGLHNLPSHPAGGQGLGDRVSPVL